MGDVRNTWQITRIKTKKKKKKYWQVATNCGVYDAIHEILPDIVCHIWFKSVAVFVIHLVRCLMVQHKIWDVNIGA